MARTFHSYNLSNCSATWGTKHGAAIGQQLTNHINRSGILIRCTVYKAYAMQQGWGNNFNPSWKE